jgi:hypothetical protein
MQRAGRALRPVAGIAILDSPASPPSPGWRHPEASPSTSGCTAARAASRAPRQGSAPPPLPPPTPGDASTAARSCLCCRTFVSASNASAARPWRRAAREIRRLWTSQDRRSQCPSAAAAAAAQHHPLPRGSSTPRAVGPLPAILSPIPFFSLDLPSLRYYFPSRTS